MVNWWNIQINMERAMAIFTITESSRKNNLLCNCFLLLKIPSKLKGFSWYIMYNKCRVGDYHFLRPIWFGVQIREWKQEKSRLRFFSRIGVRCSSLRAWRVVRREMLARYGREWLSWFLRISCCIGGVFSRVFCWSECRRDFRRVPWVSQIFLKIVLTFFGGGGVIDVSGMVTVYTILFFLANFSSCQRHFFR